MKEGLTVETRLGAVPSEAAFGCVDPVVFGDWIVAANIAENGYPGFDFTFGELRGTGSDDGRTVDEMGN